ncbi:MAG: leucine-rich repeat domain-containing protein [Clostridia bacterium]|nr:leucine-rich repeat domain-containing protein [Clostridia bacterium]
MKIRTDFVTNSSSSSFIAITITKKDGEVVKGTLSAGTDYHEIPLIEGKLEENLQFLKEVVLSTKDTFDLCDKIYSELLNVYHTADDRLDPIRDMEALDQVQTIQFKGWQEGSNGGHFDLTYNFTSQEASGNMDYKYYYEEPRGKGPITKRCDYKGELNREGNFEIVDGILMKYNGNDKDVIVPEGVIGIGLGAFSRNYSIENVYLPDSVKFIDNIGFFVCQKLKNINLPKGLERIGECAFYGCIDLEELVLPDSLIEIDVRSFYEMKSLKQIKIPEGIKEIPYEAFAYCERLEKISLPSSLEKICDSAFQSCNKIEELKIPDGVCEIDVYAFGSCRGVKSFYVPSKTSHLSPSLFNSMDMLEEIIVDEENEHYKSVDGILFTKNGKRLVRYPTSKKGKKYTIPEGTKYISEYAFLDAKEPEEIIIPETVERIGISSFFRCNSLKRIELPNSIKSVSNGAFDANEQLKEIVVPRNFDLADDCYDYWRKDLKITKK